MKRTNLLVAEDREIAFKIDRDGLEIYLYDYDPVHAVLRNEGKLQEIEPIMYKELEDYFQIDLRDYGVVMTSDEESFVDTGDENI